MTIGTGSTTIFCKARCSSILVGLVFALAVAPGLVDDLAGEVSRDPES